MSVNKFMHPRNIYRTRPNFKQLAIDYPEFCKFAKQNLSGELIIDFKDPEALRVLTCTLLKKDFDLQVEIPLDRLIPTLPLRLNYLLWIEDLLQLTDNMRNNSIHGIDIGTGSSCIYPLLAARTKKWNMLATEMDPQNTSFARQNVERNNLQSLITVTQIGAHMMLKEAVVAGKIYDFCMCNPPFFSSEDELDSERKSRSACRPPPHNVQTGAVGEVVVAGGEVAFIKRLLIDSQQLLHTVRIYSTMVGLKSSLKHVLEEMKVVGVQSWAQTEFCQGHTTRWGLAWTFLEGLDLTSVTPTSSCKKKPRPPLKYIVPRPNMEEQYAVPNISDKIRILLQQLGMKLTVLKQHKHLFTMEVKAQRNTWSHQRRKKREKTQTNQNVHQDKLQTEVRCNEGESPTASLLEISSDNLDPSLGKADQIDSLGSEKDGCDTKALKRSSEPCESGGETAKRFKEANTCKVGAGPRLEDDCSPGKQNIEDTTQSNASCERCVLKALVTIKKVMIEIHVEMEWLQGCCGRDGIHQVLQYIRNNFAWT